MTMSYCMYIYSLPEVERVEAVPETGMDICITIILLCGMH